MVAKGLHIPIWKRAPECALIGKGLGPIKLLMGRGDQMREESVLALTSR